MCRSLTLPKNTPENPFLILCDINLPAINGCEFKEQIDQDEQLKRKSIPFVFFSTASDKETINKAYSKLTVQGYFEKQHSYAETKNILSCVISYWALCKHPDE